MTHAESGRENPFWTYEDFFLFIGAMFPCAALAYLATMPLHFPSKGVQAIVSQFIWYALGLAVLYILITVRYGQPLWSSLGWNFHFPGALTCATTGPALALVLAIFGGLILRSPPDNTIQKLITDRLSLIVVMLFGVLIAPVFEELVFRGFLLPLLVRSFGPALGIVLTTVPFALLHVSTYGWTWQSLLIVGLAGLVFGYARERTGSTVASTMIHMGYNAMLFGLLLVQRWASIP